MDPRIAAVTGLLTLGGIITGALVTLTIENRRTQGQIRSELFGRRYDSYEEVLGALSELHDWMIQIVGNLDILTPEDRGRFPEQAAERSNRVTAAIQRKALGLDRMGLDGVVSYVGMVAGAADGTRAMPTIPELGDALGHAIDRAQRAMSVPELARRTFREAAGLKRRRR